MPQDGPAEGNESHVHHHYYRVLRQKLQELKIELKIFSLVNFIPLDLSTLITFYNSYCTEKSNENVSINSVYRTCLIPRAFQ